MESELRVSLWESDAAGAFSLDGGLSAHVSVERGDEFII